MRNTNFTHLRRVLLAGALLLTLSTEASHAGTSLEPDELLGRYWFPDRTGQVELYRQGDVFLGRVVAYKIPDQLDEENADPKLRGRRFVGIDMFAGFRFDAATERWQGGTVYDGSSGRTYSGYLWFEAADRSTLWARGYVGVSFLGRTERFERVEP